MFKRGWCVVAVLCALAVPAWAETQLDWAALQQPSEGHTRIYGGYAKGCIAGAESLPESGAGFQVVRLSRNRFWGHPQLIDYLENLGQRVSHAGLGTLEIGDLGQPRGGPMPFGHSSHQIGLDADIFYRLDLEKQPPAGRENLEPVSIVNYDDWTVLPGMWSNGLADVIRFAALDRRVARIFVHPVIKKALCQRNWPDEGREPDWLYKLRPWYGHDGHFHVRLKCPPGERYCENQKEPVHNTGCGAELAEWFARRPPPLEEKPEAEREMRPMPPLPLQCQSVLRAQG